MATLHYNYDQILYQQLINGAFSAKQFLTPILKSPELAAKIIDLLLAYHNRDGGGPMITDFSIVEASYQPDDKKGMVKIQYDVNRQYSCSDLNITENGHENWHFRIDESMKQLTLQIPEYEELSPSDEF